VAEEAKKLNAFGLILGGGDAREAKQHELLQGMVTELYTHHTIFSDLFSLATTLLQR